MTHTNTILSITLVAAVSLTTGCATVTRGTTQSVAIETTPQGAMIRSSTGPSCKAPCALDLKRSSDHTITATKAGYEPSSAVVTHQVSGGGAAGMAGNLVLGGIIGAAVDAGSGAMYDLTPNRVYIELEKIDLAQ